MNEVELRTAYQAGRASGRGVEGLSKGAARLGPCPDPEQLRSLAEREGEEGERLRILDHVMACPSCQEELALIRAVAGDPPTRQQRSRFLAMAASVVLLAGVGVSAWALTRPGEPATYRAEPVSPLVLLTPAPGAPGPADHFVWRPVEGAVEYRLEIFDATGQALFAATTQDTVVVLTDDVDLDGSVALNWWVRARLRDGSEVASDTKAFGGPGA